MSSGKQPGNLGSNPNCKQGWSILVAASTVLILDDLAQNIVLPVLPYYHQQLGLTSSQLGMILAAQSATVLVASAPFGAWIERHKRWTVTLLAGLLLFAFCTMLYGLARGFNWLFAARVGHGLAVALSFPTVFAIVAGSAPASRKAATLSLLNTAAAVGALATPLLSGITVDLLGIPWAFILIGAVVLLLTPVLLITLRSPRDGAGHAGSIPQALQEAPPRRLRLAGLIAAALVMFEVGLVELVVPLNVGAALGFTPAELGSYFFVLGVAFAAPQPWIGRLCDRYGAINPIRAGLLGTVLALVAASLLSGWASAAALLAAAPFLAFVFVSATAITGANPAAARAFGLFETAVALGLLLGSLVGGSVLESWGAKIAILCGAGAPLLFALIWILQLITSRTGRRR